LFFFYRFFLRFGGFFSGKGVVPQVARCFRDYFK